MLHSHVLEEPLARRRRAAPRGELAAAIDESFGSFDGFKTQLTEAAATTCRAPAGASLSWEPLGERLIVEQVYDHQGNVGQGGVPLLVFDMWEHAYYLQYKNLKADWVEAFWEIVNWQDVAKRYASAKRRAHSLLLAP